MHGRKPIPLILWIIMLMLAGCGAQKQNNPETNSLAGQIETIGSLGPAITEILTGLGLGGQIILTDTYSSDVAGINPQVLYTDMMTPDVEQIIQAAPDILFVTGMTLAGGDDPYKPVSDAGVQVVYRPSTNSMAGIFEDIRFLAELTGAEAQGEAMIAAMEAEIAKVAQVTENIPEAARKRVYFEIAPFPHIVSFGADVFLDELLELAGGINIMSGYSGYISINDEVILEANPHVILTSVDYIDDPVGDVLSRDGWDAVAAIQEGQVYQVDTNTTNRASQNVVLALEEIAGLIYPEYYGN